MATYVEHHSGLADCITYPTFPRPRVRIDSRFPAERQEQRPVSSTLQKEEDGCLFQESLIVSGAKSRPRNPWAAVGSLCIQLFLLTALVVIPLYLTDPLPKLQTVTMLYAPPPAAAGSTVTPLRVPTPTPIAPSTSISIPNPVHKTQEAAPQVDVASGVIGGVPGGVVGGIPGGVISEVLGSTSSTPVLAKTPEPTAVSRIRVAARVAEANLIHDVAPTYPPEAGRARIEGTVVLLAVIGKDGTVQDVRVESGLPMLAQAAIDAVRQWRYRPYLLNGEPVEVDSRITINFTLSS